MQAGIHGGVLMNKRSEVEAEINEIEEAEIEKALDVLHIHPGCSPFYLHLLTGISIPRLNEMVESGNIVRRYVDLTPYYFTPEQIQDREREALSISAGCGTHTIAADIKAITACISKAETTATPSKALALQEARGHLLRASMAVERARAEIKVSAEVTMKYGHDLDKYVVI
jgi:hypothetical protein